MLFQKLFFFLSYFLVLLAFWFMSLDYPSLLPPTCSLTYAMDLLLEAYFYFLLLINFFFSHKAHFYGSNTKWFIRGSGQHDIARTSIVFILVVVFLAFLSCFYFSCCVFSFSVVVFFCCCVYGFDIMFLFQLLQGFMLVPLLWFFCCCVFIFLLLCFYFSCCRVFCCCVFSFLLVF